MYVMRIEIYTRMHFKHFIHERETSTQKCKVFPILFITDSYGD